MNEAEWSEATIASGNSRAVTSSSSGCSSFLAEAGPENETSHVLFPPKTNVDLSATGPLSLQGPTDCATVSHYGELQAEQEST
jgi:hypothetical protein